MSYAIGHLLDMVDQASPGKLQFAGRYVSDHGEVLSRPSDFETRTPDIFRWAKLVSEQVLSMRTLQAIAWGSGCP